ncbi:DUF1508 domain-containing protein, partial [Pseudoalteromonas sp.]|uniref:DUF1508 domain-containing protein n=1 Tax=Pseudoalteromonas sp. TaxID=53249 RepID=UPI003001FA22
TSFIVDRAIEGNYNRNLNGEHYFDFHALNQYDVAATQRYDTAESRDGAIATVQSDGKTRTVKT